jgi:putative zinc finger/helix-turn-helix YgiT family protein
MKKKNVIEKTCPICGKGILKALSGEFKATFEDNDGKRRDLLVPNITYEKCDSCGEELLDQDASKRISQAQRAAMGLLSADQIRAIRQKLGRTQRKMSELLGIGEKTYCRWESGTHFQSEAFDRYLRLLTTDLNALKALERIQLEKEFDTEAHTSDPKFAYLDDISVYEEASIQFIGILQTGPFCPA